MAAKMAGKTTNLKFPGVPYLIHGMLYVLSKVFGVTGYESVVNFRFQKSKMAAKMAGKITNF